MKDEQEKDDELTAIFQQGFNDGYMLREQMPDLAKSLGQSLEGINSEWATAFKDGMAQYDVENNKDLTLDWGKDHDRGNDELTPDKGKEDIEPELG